MKNRLKDSFVKHDENNINVQIGARLRNLRLLQGLSQDKLGQMMGISFQQIQKYEKGINRLSARRLVQLASIFKIPVQTFFGDEKETGMPLFTQQNDLAILDHLPRMNDNDKAFLALFIRFLVRYRAKTRS